MENQIENIKVKQRKWSKASNEIGEIAFQKVN